MNIRIQTAALMFMLFVLYAAGSREVAGQTYLRNICRVKGQEEVRLQGIGLVVGLSGTGEKGFLPTSRALSTMMRLMGNPIAEGQLAELKDVRNVGLVFVTATVPATGARRGDRLDCQVSAVNAKSLAGGVLLRTPLLGPAGSKQIYAFGEGKLSTEGGVATAAVIHDGCRLEEDFANPYSKDDKITLVLNNNMASFRTAQEVADLINAQPFFQGRDPYRQGIAKAVDAKNIVITIPEQYRDAKVLFVTQILDTRIVNPRTEARVVVNERTGTIVIGADVRVGAVAVTHGNLVIETGGPASPLLPVDPDGRGGADLKALVAALDRVKVSAKDKIDIIKTIEKTGNLYGKLIVK